MTDNYKEHKFHKGNVSANKNTCSDCFNEYQFMKMHKKRIVTNTMDSREMDLMDLKMSYNNLCTTRN